MLKLVCQADNTCQNMWIYISSFPLWDSGQAKAAFISLLPRPKKTATPWTRAAVCSPASQRWCTTTAPSVCLSTAPSTWLCYTRCPASTDSAPAELRYTKQTHLWANMDKMSPKISQDLISDQCVLLLPCPFPQVSLYNCFMCYFYDFNLTIREYLQLTLWMPSSVFIWLWCVADANHLGCCFACEQGGSSADDEALFND